MKVLKLRPIQYPQTLEDRLEREIQKVITREIYSNVLKLLNLKNLIIKNALTQADVSKLGEALRFGNLTYLNGMFSGPLDASLTRALRDVGAKWDKRLAVFRLAEDDMPPDLVQLISSAQDGYKNHMRMVDKYLSRIDPEEVSGKVAVKHLFENAINKTEKSFTKNIKVVTLTPSLTDEERSQLVDDWRTRAHASITGLVKDQVSQLRKRVSHSVEVGTRYSNLTKGIQHDYSVSVGRAKLIARQETKTLVNTYAKKRYDDAGVKEYYWHHVAGTKAHPVRARHEALGNASKNGTTYRFDDPPVVTEPGEPERRGNPGDDFNCRCWAQPVIKFGGQ